MYPYKYTNIVIIWIVACNVTRQHLVTHRLCSNGSRSWAHGCDIIREYHVVPKR